MVNISVIIPIYNGEKYIRRCIESLLNQTYQEFEVLLIDNNSSDNSYMICSRYAESTNKIYLLQEMKAGPGCARNKGLSVAKGKYITFLDCDDYWEPNYLDEMIKAASEQIDYDLILCGRFFEKNDAHEEVEIIGKEHYKHTMVRKAELQKDPYTFFKYNGTRGPVCKLFKKSIIEHNKIRFPETIRMFEDLCFCMEYISHCENVVLIEPVLYHQFKHDDSLSKSNKLDDLQLWECVIDVLQGTISRTTGMNWLEFYQNILNGFPMQCINTYTQQNIGIKECTNRIYNFLKRGDITTYIEEHCNNSEFGKMLRSRIYIAYYIIKRRTKQVFYRKIKSKSN
mgnify:CR=1 FL=1